MAKLRFKDSEFLREYIKPWQDIQNSIIVLVRIFNPNSKESRSILLHNLAIIEIEINKLLSTNSKYYWFHLESRIFPTLPDCFNHENLFSKVNESRHRLRLSILKYGLDISDTKDDEFIIDSNHSNPKEIKRKQFRAIYSVEMLCHIYTILNTLLRRVNKKSNGLRVNREGELEVSQGIESYETIERFDKRLYKYYDILSEMGGISNNEILINAEDILDNSIIMVIPNSTELTYELEKPKIHYKPNYLFLYKNLDFFEKLLSNKSMLKEYKHIQGFSFQELVMFFVSLSNTTSISTSNKQNAFFQIHQRGYYFITNKNYENFKQTITKEYISLIEKKLKKKESFTKALNTVTAIMDWLSYTGENYNEIDIKLLTPSKLIIPNKDGYIIDLRMILAIIRDHLLLMGGFQGQAGTTKGDMFEVSVRELLRNEGFNLWKDKDITGKRNLVYSPDGKESEFDFAVIVGKSLYIGECKAWHRSKELVDGSVKALKIREDEIRDALTKIKRTMEVVKSERNSLGVPTEITNFEHILVTPHVEYIHSIKEKYWLNNEFPRILVPEEVVEYYKQLE